MIIVQLGENVNVEHFKKFELLYSKVIEKYKLQEYAVRIQYVIYDKKTINRTYIDSEILDHTRFMKVINHKVKIDYYVVNSIHKVYMSISENGFKKNFTKNEMLTLNTIYRLIK